MQPSASVLAAFNRGENIPISEFIKLNPVQQNRAWYDWFCKDHALPKKTVKLVRLLREVLEANGIGAKFDPTKCYVFFKNNCPLNGPLYDDFRICDLATGDVLYTIVPKSGHTHRAEVWGEFHRWKNLTHDREALMFGKWSDVLKFFRGELDSFPILEEAPASTEAV